MSKGSLYAAFLNALLGVLLSLLLQGNLLIYVITFIVFLTILIIERRWIYEKIFQRKPWRAMAGYGVLAVAVAGFFVFVTRSNRDTLLIVQTTQAFVQHLKPGEYAKSYEVLSTISKKTYPKDNFIKDHQRSAVTVQDFRIDEIKFNEFDKRKAVVRLSSPFSIYGQSSLAFELIKEAEQWKLVFSPTLLAQKASKPASSAPSSAPRREKRRSSDSPETVGRILKSFF